MITLLICSLTLPLGCPAWAAEDVAGACRELAQALHQYTPERDSLLDRKGFVPVAICEFPSAIEGQDGLTALSAEIKAKLGGALVGAGFSEVERDVKILLREQELQTSDIVVEGTTGPVAYRGVRGIVRGHYIYRPGAGERVGRLLIFAKLTLCRDGTVVRACTELPYTIPELDRPVVAPPPKPEPGHPAETPAHPALPANKPMQDRNRQKLEEFRKLLPGVGLEPRIWVTNGQQNFRDGDIIQYGIRVDADAHVAVFCHQVDGTTNILFPNDTVRNTFVRKGQKHLLGTAGEDAGSIRVGPPYGADIVQIVACTDRDALLQLVANVRRQSTPSYRGMDYLRPPNDKPPRHSETAPPGRTKWGESHIIVYTHAAPLTEPGGR